MNINIIKEKFPKSYNQLIKYVTSLIKAQGVTEEVLMSFPIEAAITMTFNSSQSLRSLYDFMDGYDIIMCPICIGGGDWQISINRYNPEGYSKNRIEAEETGFSKCFELLEKKLTL